MRVQTPVMRITGLFLLIGLSITSSVFSQSSLSYTFTTATNASLTTTSNGVPYSMAAAINLFANNSTVAGNAFFPAPDFHFMGKRYNVLVVNLDGVVGLAVDANVNSMTQTVNGLLRTVQYPPTTNTGPAIAPFWDDLKTALSGKTASAVVVGTAPNRCIVVEWNANINQSSFSTTADGVFHLRMYEGTGRIEYVYGKMQIGTSSTLVTASIGFTAGTTNNSFIALKDLTTLSTTGLTSEEVATRSLVNTAVPGSITALNSTADGSRRIFSFLPPAVNGNVLTAFVDKTYATSMQLNWTDNITNHLGYLIYRSVVDSNNYQFVTSLSASTKNYLATSLNTNTRYYWKVIPFTEGNTQTVSVLTDSTRCSMAGNYSVGPTGTFTTLKAAKDSLSLWGIRNNTTWELQSNYSFASETLPVTLKSLPACYDNNSTITIRPATGANISYTSISSINPVILLDSTTNVIIDGRAGGTGAIALALQGPNDLIRIRNSWNNVVQYVDIASNATTSNNAALVIESTTANGCFDNTIKQCNFHDRASQTMPEVLLLGKVNGTVQNTRNNITQNNFYNFRRQAIVVNGTAWNITGNSFYATSPVTTTDSSGFILLATEEPNLYHKVSGNYFGGSQPACGGSLSTYNTGSVFTGLNAWGNAVVSNNTFKKLYLECVTPQVYQYSSIDFVLLGKTSPSYGAYTDSALNNSFGAEQPGDSICISNNSQYTLGVCIIRNQGYTSSTIRGNNLVHIKTLEKSGQELIFNMIYNSAAAVINQNNISTTNHAYRVTHRGTGRMAVIATGSNACINNNTMTNVLAYYNVTGIVNSGNYQQVTGNNISYIKSAYGSSPNGGDFYSAAGIASFSSQSAVSTNRIIHIQDSSVAAASTGPSSIFTKQSWNTYNRNFIDGLDLNENITGSKSLYALNVYDDHSAFYNNMVRIGVDSAGTSFKKGLFMVFSNDYTSSNSVYHNTFYVAGDTNIVASGLSGAQCAFWLGPAYFVNNIMVMDRSYANNTGNAAIYLNSSQSQNTNIDYNVYKFAPTAKFSTSYPTFQQWQAIGNDPNSYQKDPNLVMPTGPTRTLDLHVSGTTPVENRGSSFYTVGDDYDGQVRAANTPVDIGADAGLFIKMDLEPPRFFVTPLAEASDTSSRYISVRITDSISGIRDTGAVRPTIWYRKSFPTVSPWQYAYGTPTSGNSKDGIWRFFINHQQLNVSQYGNDSIQYYFVAQDTTAPLNFVGVSPAAGTLHTSPTQQVSAPAQPYIYRIYLGGYIMPSVVNVGRNEKYLSLTRDGGLFESISRDSISSTSVTVKITSHLIEDGKWSLDSLITRKNIQLKIVPAYDSVFIIKNQVNLSTGLIRLNNADDVTIDGSFNGSGRWLRFINTHTSADSGKATFALTEGTDRFKLRNSQVMNNTSDFYASGIVLMNDGDFTDVEIRNNLFSDVAGIAGKPAAGVMATVNARPVRLVAALNHFANMNISAVYFNGAADRARLDSNHIFWSDPGPHTSNDFYGLYTGGGYVTTHQMNGNYIGGSQPFALGNPWVNNAPIYQFNFLKMLTGSNLYSSISNNTIRNFSMTNTGGNASFSAIVGYGTMNINGNLIGDTINNSSIQLAGGSGANMIYVTGGKQLIGNNIISGITNTSNNSSSSLIGIWSTGDSVVTIKGNVVKNLFNAAPVAFSSSATISGIYTFPAAIIEGNDISNLVASNSQAVKVYGIHILMASGTISRNRIYNNTLPNSNGGTLAGIYLGGGSWKMYNNQVTLANGSNTNSVNIFGIQDKSTNPADTKDILYNTLLVGGSQSSGTTPSFGFMAEGLGITRRFRNNLVVNVRSGGTGQHGAVAVKTTTPAASWPGNSGNYNLYVNKDTSKAMLWGTTTQLSMSGWRNSSASDSASYITPASVLIPSQLFRDTATGKLDIDTTKNLCWYVNGKGMPIYSFSADFYQDNIRSTRVSSGPTDIGSHEFTTSVPPPPLFVYGRHQPGGADTLSFNGKMVAIVNWGNAGTLPTLGAGQWFSGVWPNDTTNGGGVQNARYLSSYLRLPATGGSGYSYNLIYFYDSSMLGKVTNEPSMIMNKRQIGVNGSWQTIPSIVNVGKKSITISNQSSFSEFTATDAAATLPVNLLSFVAAADNNNVQLAWTMVPADELQFVIERSLDGSSFRGVINQAATAVSSYTAVDPNAFNIEQVTTLYYRLKMISKTGEITYSKIAVVKRGNRALVLAVSPNPFTSGIKLTMTLDRDEVVNIAVGETTGNLIFNKKLSLTKGLHNLRLDELAPLPAGYYFLTIKTKQTREVIKLVKVK